MTAYGVVNLSDEEYKRYKKLDLEEKAVYLEQNIDDTEVVEWGIDSFNVDPDDIEEDE
jgi:hypothetical protein